MKVYLNSISGLDDAIVALHESKRSLTKDRENEIREIVKYYTSDVGSFDEVRVEFGKLLNPLVKWGTRHITLLKFIDLSFTVYDIHRGAQDDIDSHAKRMDNRIIRASTRLADFKGGEMSDFYKGKIIPTDQALEIMNVAMPEELVYDGNTYVKAVNGYILKGLENDKDVKRGLYMLSIPSTFNFKVNLAEFAHIYKERNKDSSANPEVKEAVEEMASLLDEYTAGVFNREYLLSIRN